MGLILFKLEDVGDVLYRLFESGISYSIESDCKNITYDIGDANGNFIDVLDDMESKSISYTISRVAREAAEEYPDSGFAVWYRGLLGRDSGKAVRRALFEIGGRMIFHEYTISDKYPFLKIENERYCWGDGTTCETIETIKPAKKDIGFGILEFSKQK